MFSSCMLLCKYPMSFLCFLPVAALKKNQQTNRKSPSQCVPARVKHKWKNNVPLKERQETFSYIACDGGRQSKKIPMRPFYPCRLSHAQRSAVKVLRRMQYFVARRKFQVSENSGRRKEKIAEKKKKLFGEKQEDVCVFVAWGVGMNRLKCENGGERSAQCARRRAGAP